MLGGVTRHILPHLPRVPHLHVNRPLVTRLLEEMSYASSFNFFFTAAHFHFALVEASISHVKWLGYSDDFNSWIPLSSLQDLSN